MALKRKSGNKVYYFDSYFRQKGRAMGQAKSLRQGGNLARVTYNKRDEVWEVWARSK